MNYIRSIMFAILLLLSHAARAQSEYNYTLESNHSIDVYGTASLHNWSLSFDKAEGICAVYRNEDGTVDLNQLELMLEANSIKSSGGPVMDINTAVMLKSGLHPKITFKLTSPVKSILSDGNGQTVSASGILTVAGITKQITLHVKVTSTAEGEIAFEGSKLINMRDFNIVPPTALFGVLKVSNEISIQFKTNFIKENNL